MYSTHPKEEVERMISNSINQTFVNSQFLVSFHVKRKLPCHTLRKVCEVNGDCPASYEIKRAGFDSNRKTVVECLKTMLQNLSQDSYLTCSSSFNYEMKSLTIPQSLIDSDKKICAEDTVRNEIVSTNNCLVTNSLNNDSFHLFYPQNRFKNSLSVSNCTENQESILSSLGVIDGTFLNFSSHREMVSSGLDQSTNANLKQNDRSLNLTDLLEESHFNPTSHRKQYIDRSADLFLDNNESSSFLTHNSTSTNRTFNSFQTFCQGNDYSISTPTSQYHPNINSPDLFADSTTDSFGELTINEEN